MNHDGMIFLAGSCAYPTLEMAWRGHTHYSKRACLPGVWPGRGSSPGWSWPLGSSSTTFWACRSGITPRCPSTFWARSACPTPCCGAASPCPPWPCASCADRPGGRTPEGAIREKAPSSPLQGSAQSFLRRCPRACSHMRRTTAAPPHSDIRYGSESARDRRHSPPSAGAGC